MTKCAKCKRTIHHEEGFYNYPSGALHIICGEAKNQKIKAIQKKYGLMTAIASESLIKP